MSERRQLEKVGDLIDAVLGKVARSGVAPVVRLRQQWPQVAGEWADRSRPVAIERGVVTVEVGSGMDATMLRYDVAGLLESVRAELGDEVRITKISVRVGRGR